MSKVLTGEKLIQLRNVCRTYASRSRQNEVLHGVNLDLKAGEFISIMGPSGSGKSTLLNILGMLDDGFSGEYHLLGQAVHQLKPKHRQQLARENIGFVFQHYHLLDDMTVSENIELILTYRNWGTQQRRQAIHSVLERFELTDKQSDYPNQLSGGQQQMVAVARAVVAQPRLILADEPTGALHSEQGKIIMQLLADLNNQGTTIIQVTHNPDNALFGQRIVEIFDGQIR